jgi:N-hydroxyarylamine O-acetyltransferase
VRLGQYLERLGVTPPLGAGAAAVGRLHRAHCEAFLFENLSIQTGGRISLALADLERKFLDERRGGYCFEHNVLFAAALGDLDFKPITLLGRVRRGPPERWARTHMVLRVSIGGEPWLADVGFGGLGLLEPMPLRHGAVSMQCGLTYTLRRDDHVWVLSMSDATSSSMDLYEFADDPQTKGDLEVANHFTSTHHDSIFRQTLTIQRTRRDERTILRNGTLTRYREGRMAEEPIERGRLHEVARDVFGVDLPSGPFLFEAAAPGSDPRLTPATAQRHSSEIRI